MERAYTIEVELKGKIRTVPLIAKTRIIPNGIWISYEGKLRVWHPQTIILEWQ